MIIINMYIYKIYIHAKGDKREFSEKERRMHRDRESEGREGDRGGREGTEGEKGGLCGKRKGLYVG